MKRALVLVAVGAAALVLAAGPAGARGRQVESLRLTGVVDPFEADYITSGIRAAADDGAIAVLLTIDTPGGLDSSMRKITQALALFAGASLQTVEPDPADVAGFDAFLRRYVAALPVERAAVDHVKEQPE